MTCYAKSKRWLIGLCPLLLFCLNALAQELDKNLFTSSEWERLKRERTLNPRLKIYMDACNRHISQIQRAFKENREDDLRAGLVAFAELLKVVEDDISDQGDRRARNLKRFEVSLRENINTLVELKKGSTLSQQDIFEDTIDKAQRLRRAILSLIFGEEKLRDQ